MIRAILFLAAALVPAFAQDVVLPDGKAKEVVSQACSDCHGLEKIVDNPMSVREVAEPPSRRW